MKLKSGLTAFYAIQLGNRSGQFPSSCSMHGESIWPSFYSCMQYKLNAGISHTRLALWTLRLFFKFLMLISFLLKCKICVNFSLAVVRQTKLDSARYNIFNQNKSVWHYKSRESWKDHVEINMHIVLYTVVMQETFKLQQHQVDGLKAVYGNKLDGSFLITAPRNDPRQ